MYLIHNNRLKLFLEVFLLVLIINLATNIEWMVTQI